ncbi:hypothetical protein AAVH_39428, partial [Aphelenchoides avenae]
MASTTAAGAGVLIDASSIEGEWKRVLPVGAKPSLRIEVTGENWTIEEGVPLDNAPTVTRFKLDEPVEIYDKLYYRGMVSDKLHTKQIFRLSNDTLTEDKEEYKWVGVGGLYQHPSIRKKIRKFQIKGGRLKVEERGPDRTERVYKRCSSTREKRLQPIDDDTPDSEDSPKKAAKGHVNNDDEVLLIAGPDEPPSVIAPNADGTRNVASTMQAPESKRTRTENMAPVPYKRQIDDKHKEIDALRNQLRLKDADLETERATLTHVQEENTRLKQE